MRPRTVALVAAAAGAVAGLVVVAPARVARAGARPCSSACSDGAVPRWPSDPATAELETLAAGVRDSLTETAPDGPRTPSTPACCRRPSRARCAAAATSPRSSWRTATASACASRTGASSRPAAAARPAPPCACSPASAPTTPTATSVDEAGLTAAADAVAAAVRAGARRPRASSSSARSAADPAAPRARAAGDGGHRAQGRAGARRRRGRARPPAPRSSQAIVGYGDTRQQVLIANSLGDLVLRRPHAHALHRPGRGAPRRRHPDGPRDASAAAPASSSSTRRSRARVGRARPPRRR